MAEEKKEEELVNWSKSAEFEKCQWQADIYPGVLTGVEDFVGEHGPKKRFLFNATNLKLNKTMELAYSAYPTVRPSTKAGNLVLALGVKENESFKWKDLIGRKCRLVLEPKNIDGTQRTVVTRVMPDA